MILLVYVLNVFSETSHSPSAIYDDADMAHDMLY